MLIIFPPSVYSHIVNFYLAPLEPTKYTYDAEKYKADLAIYQEKSRLQEKIVALATHYSAESQTHLEGYAREALRS